MIDYDQISGILGEEIPLNHSNRQLVRSSDVDNVFENSNWDGAETIILGNPRDFAEFYTLAERRGDERTFYADTDNDKVAIKVYGQGRNDIRARNSGLETANQEAEMLQAARDAGIDVAEPVAVNRTDSETFLIKNAGSPENGEVPYWITDVGHLGQSGEYSESGVESHLAEAMETSMRQLMELSERGIVHRSLTPMSHRENDGFSVYDGFNNVRYLSPEVNFTPTGELKDFEHAERSFGDNQNIGDPIAETVVTYLWTAKGAGLDDDTAASVVSGPIDELSTDYDIMAPNQADLRQIANSISDFALETGQDPDRSRGYMSATPIREVTRQITGDIRIDGVGTFGSPTTSQGIASGFSSSSDISPASTYEPSQKISDDYFDNLGGNTGSDDIYEEMENYKIENDLDQISYL